MNPFKYSQMIKYLTRAKKANPELPDVFPASKAPIPPVRKDVETMDAINAFIRRERQQKAGGGMLVQPSADGSRPGYAAPRKITVDDDKLVAEWRNQLTKKNPVKWNMFLKNKFGESTREALDSRINRKFKKENITWNPAKEFATKVNPKQTRYNLVKKLVDEHNASDKFLYDKQEIFKKLNLRRIMRKEQPEIFELFDTLESKDDKIKKAFDKIVNENLTIYKPKNLRAKSGKQAGLVKQMISDIVSPKKGALRNVANPLYIQKVLNSYQPYLDIKSNFDYLDKFQSTNFINKSFNEALEYSQYSRGGLDIKGLAEFKGGYGKPEKVIYQFAARHAFLNNKQGTPSQVEFFKLNKKGEPVGKAINFNNLPKDAKTSARILDSKNYGFKYKGQFFNQDNLKIKGFNSGLFDEVFSLTKKGQTTVPNPNNPSEQTTLRKLLQDSGDKLTIGHNDAKGGIAKLPFNNLRIESGKLNLSLYGAYSRVKNKQLRKLIVDNLATKFPSINLKGEAYEKAFVNEQSNILKNLDKEKVSLSPYRAAGQQVVKDLGQDFFKQSKSFQKEALRVVGRDNVKEILAGLKTVDNSDQIKLARIGCPGKATGGRVGYFEGQNLTACAIKGVEKIKNDPVNLTGGDQQNLRALGKSGKAIRFLKNILGPAAIAGELIFEGGFAANKFMSEGVPLKQALGESYINKYLLGPKTQIDVEAEREKEFAKGEDFAMAKRGERMAPFMAQSKEADTQRLKKREEEMKALYPDLQFANPNNQQIDQILKEQKVFSPFTLGFGMQQMQPGIGDTKYNEDAAYQEIRNLINKNIDERVQSQQMQNIADAGGIANLAGGGIAKMAGDSSGRPPESGPQPQGLLSLINRVRNY